MSSRAAMVVLDLRDIGRNRRGVARVLTEVGSRLLAWYPDRYHGICGPGGPELMRDIRRDQVTVIGQHSQAVFEQITLPLLARKLGAKAVYSHRECGALWGPPLLLHVPEDPEIRWSKGSAREVMQIVDLGRGTGRERSRRAYSRLIMNRSLRRCRVVTSTTATAADLERRHGMPTDRVTVVPLGVDLEHFRPVGNGQAAADPYFFHLSSNDPREHSSVVIEAFACFAAQTPCPPRLVVAGDPGPIGPSLHQLTADLGVAEQVDFRGWVTDDDLVRLYAGAAATVMASDDEGFGLQPLEAMACGSLFVAAPTPATKEIAVGAEVEWAPLEAAPMASAFARIWADRSRQARAALVNREVASRFSWDKTAKQLHELLGEMAEQNVR